MSRRAALMLGLLWLGLLAAIDAAILLHPRHLRLQLGRHHVRGDRPVPHLI